MEDRPVALRRSPQIRGCRPPRTDWCRSPQNHRRARWRATSDRRRRLTFPGPRPLVPKHRPKRGERGSPSVVSRTNPPSITALQSGGMAPAAAMAEKPCIQSRPLPFWIAALLSARSVETRRPCRLISWIRSGPTCGFSTSVARPRRCGARRARDCRHARRQRSPTPSAARCGRMPRVAANVTKTIGVERGQRSPCMCHRQ